MTSGVVALLFTDLVRSTELLARLGDDAAEDLRRTHFGLLRQVTTLTARAHPMGGADAFGLWAEVLDGHFRGLDPREVSELCGGFLDDLAAISRAVAAVRGSVPERPPSRLGLLEGLTVVLANLVATGPVVSLDDVHLADASSWDALHYVADNLAQVPLLVVATARPEELAGHVVASQVLFSLEQDAALDRAPDPVRQGIVKLRLANLLAWGMGDAAAAERACTEAERLEPLECRLFFGRALDVLGRALAAIDPARAREALERAVEVFAACGATWRRDRALDALGQLQDRVR